jgi:hypothetical protein
MSQLFCKVGDLAVTVEAEIAANIGNVVKIVRAVGYDGFSDYQKIFLWEVEIASSERMLIYEYPNGKIKKCRRGRVPDRYLRPIRPDQLESEESLVQDQPQPHSSLQGVQYEEVEYV